MLDSTTSDLAEFRSLLPHLLQFQTLAERYGIPDVFQDNGGKLLEILLLSGLTVLPGRTGNDAVDSSGAEYEIKTLNTRISSGFSTSHHVNASIIDKYRRANWMFALYDGIELTALYRLTPDQLEPLFLRWERKWEHDRRDINNPKIPLDFVRTRGDLVYTIPCGSLADLLG